MPYTQQQWLDDTTTAPYGPINGTRLNYMEAGIGTAQATADSSAPLASPTFSGTPSLPTATTGVTQSANDSSTKIATTLYVDTADKLSRESASSWSARRNNPTGGTNATRVLGWNVPPEHGWQFASSPVKGVLSLMKVPVVISGTIGNIAVIVYTGGTSVSNGFVGVYSIGTATLTLLGQSAAQTTAWQSSAEKTIPITVQGGQSLAVTAGYESYVAVGVLVGTATTTAPKFGAPSGGFFNLGISNSDAGQAGVFNVGTISSGLTALPGTVTISSIAADSNNIITCAVTT